MTKNSRILKHIKWKMFGRRHRTATIHHDIADDGKTKILLVYPSLYTRITGKPIVMFEDDMYEN